MKISEMKLFCFSLPLKQDILIGNNLITKRTGLILELTDKNQNIGYGEISPLPFYSDESMVQGEEEMGEVSKSILNLSISSTDDIFDFTKAAKLSGSVSFGIESALLETLSRSLNKKTEQLLSENSLNEIVINALLSGRKQEIIDKAKELKNRNYRSVKLKVGSLSVEQATELTEQVNQVLTGQAAIRLDFNQRWRLNDIIRFYGNVKQLPIEYLEEPLADISQMNQLDSDPLNIPFALDEQLRTISPHEISAFKNLKAVILKPTVLGLGRTLEFAKIAREHKILSVISSTFESQVGMVMLARVASSLNQNNCPMGLDTIDVFAESLLDEPSNLSGDTINVLNLPDLTKSLKIKMLKEIIIT